MYLCKVKKGCVHVLRDIVLKKVLNLTEALN